MIEGTETGRKGEIGESAGDGAAALGDLVGVGEVQLRAVGDARRTESEFPAANQSLRDGEREENAGGADVVVVEEIPDVGFEVVGVEDPAAERNSDAELMFFIALAIE